MRNQSLVIGVAVLAWIALCITGCLVESNMNDRVTSLDADKLSQDIKIVATAEKLQNVQEMQVEIAKAVATLTEHISVIVTAETQEAKDRKVMDDELAQVLDILLRNQQAIAVEVQKLMDAEAERKRNKWRS